MTEESLSEFGLIIDGKSLAYAMDKTLVNSFMDLAMRCATVICCRSSPKQKAVVSIMFVEPSKRWDFCKDYQTLKQLT